MISWTVAARPFYPWDSPGQNTRVAVPFSGGSSRPRDWTQVSYTAGRFLTICAIREALLESRDAKNWKNWGGGEQSRSQEPIECFLFASTLGLFLTQLTSNPTLPQDAFSAPAWHPVHWAPPYFIRPFFEGCLWPLLSYCGYTAGQVLRASCNSLHLCLRSLSPFHSPWGRWLSHPPLFPPSAEGACLGFAYPWDHLQFSSVTQLCPTLWPHELQHTRLPCSSPTPGAYSNSCSLSWWCHPMISSSVVPFSSHLQSFPASGSFPMSQFFESGGHRIGVSASASVLPVNI